MTDLRVIEDLRGGGGGMGDSWECRLFLIGGGGGTFSPAELWPCVGLMEFRSTGGGGIAEGDGTGEEVWCTGVVRRGGGGGTADGDGAGGEV